jgi:hypothetical protein
VALGTLQLETLVRASLASPSITTWTRLEPSPRDGSMTRSLQAQVRDPLWMLARQWQVGEYLGADAGSPVNASFAGELQTITTYFPGTDPSAAVPLDPGLPLEAHVERETVSLKLRGSVQLGFYFESLVSQQVSAGAAAVVAGFRAAFPIPPAPGDPTYTPVDALRFRSLMAGRVTDGEALYAAAAAVAAGKTPTTPLPPEASHPGVPGVLSAFLAYRAGLFSEPDADAAWQGEQLQYEFGIGSPAPGSNLVLDAPDFPGGRLDWYSFSLGSPGADPIPAANPAAITPVTFDFLPNRVTFRGVHDPRWWTFEDSGTDFGQLDVQHVDLAKLLVMEFALVYGNDWFSVPVPASFGNLARVTTLVVADTFGQRTLSRPSEQTTVHPGEAPWSMFKLSGGGARSDFIVLAPTLGIVEDADAVEDVMFLRDDMAAMAWAVEKHLHGDLDVAIDAQEAYLDRLRANPPAPPPAATLGGPQVYYTLEVPVPDNWIPMVPEQTAQSALYLRRGTMEIPTSAGLLKVVPRALLLEPGQPFFVADHVVSRAGVQAERYFRRARSSDGNTFLWLARSSGPGQGPGWSGLGFDVVRPLARRSGGAEGPAPPAPP